MGIILKNMIKWGCRNKNNQNNNKETVQVQITMIK